MRLRRTLVTLSVACVAAVTPAAAAAHNPPPPNPNRIDSTLVQRMYDCNKGKAAWIESEIRCAIRVRFGPAGQYDNAVRIARCETGDTWDPQIVSRTDDHGIFQINRRWNTEGWRLGADIYDPVWNTRIAYWFWQTRGWGDWVCARLVGVR